MLTFFLKHSIAWTSLICLPIRSGFGIKTSQKLSTSYLDSFESRKSYSFSPSLSHIDDLDSSVSPWTQFFTVELCVCSIRVRKSWGNQCYLKAYQSGLVISFCPLCLMTSRVKFSANWCSLKRFQFEPKKKKKNLSQAFVSFFENMKKERL